MLIVLELSQFYYCVFVFQLEEKLPTTGKEIIIFDDDYLKDFFFHCNTHYVTLREQPPRQHLNTMDAGLMSANYQVYNNIDTYFGDRDLSYSLPVGSTLVVNHDPELSKLHQQNMAMYREVIQGGTDPIENKDVPADDHLIDFKTQNEKEKRMFLLWLLSEQDPIGYGELISPQCNHRQTDQAVFDQEHPLHKERPDVLLTKSREIRGYQFFQNGDFELLPYEVVPRTKDNSHIPYVSIVTGKFKQRAADESEIEINSLNIKVRDEMYQISQFRFVYFVLVDCFLQC